MAFTNRASPFENELKSMPKNSKFGQYIPWSAAKQDFDLASFDGQVCDCLSLDDLRAVVSALRKSKYYQPGYIPLSCWLIPAVIVGLILLISILNWSNTATAVARRLTLACLILLLLLPVVLMVLAKKAFRNWSPMRVDKLKGLLKELQLTILKNKMAELRISNLGSYLIIDYSKSIWASSVQLGLPG